MNNKYKSIINNFTNWGTTSDKVKAAIVVGSQARNDYAADEHSDLDIIMFVDDPEYFSTSEDWLNEIGSYHITFTEPTMDGAKERRILFDGNLDVDIVIQPYSLIEAVSGTEAASVLMRGYSILIDKIGLSKKLELLRAMNSASDMPSEYDFINIVNDFWYHTVWTAKKLKRGELWTAKFCMDSYMKRKLLTIIECHARVGNGVEYDTWYGGRFVEQWAEPWVINELRYCFALYNEESIRNALSSTMSLFRTLSKDVAEKLMYHYPISADEYTTACVAEILA